MISGHSVARIPRTMPRSRDSADAAHPGVGAVKNRSVPTRSRQLGDGNLGRPAPLVWGQSRSSGGISGARPRSRAQAIVSAPDTLQPKAWGASSPLSPGSVHSYADQARVIGSARCPPAVVRWCGENRFCEQQRWGPFKNLPLTATGCHFVPQSDGPRRTPAGRSVRLSCSTPRACRAGKPDRFRSLRPSTRRSRWRGIGPIPARRGDPIVEGEASLAGREPTCPGRCQSRWSC
jgi:hypothetical protein